MPPQPLVSVIILHFRHPAVSADCLAQVLAQDHDRLEVWLVDNASGEELDSLPGLEDPRVRLLRADSNLGFAAGNNLAMRQASGDFVVLINNDVILPSNWISAMIRAWPGSNWGLLSSVIVKFGSDNVLQYAGYTPVSAFTGRNRVLGAGQTWVAKDKVEPTAYAQGSAMMVSRAALDAAGLLPERYFLYYEELDWSERVRRAGFQVGVYHGVAAPHYGSLTLGKDSPDRWYYYHRGRLIFQRSWLAPWQKPVFLLYYLFIASPKELLMHSLQKKWGHLAAWAQALGWHLRHPGRLPDWVGPRNAGPQ